MLKQICRCFVPCSSVSLLVIDSTIIKILTFGHKCDKYYNMRNIFINVFYADFKNKLKGLFLYNAVSSPQDCSKHFSLRPLADLFIPKPTGLLWEALSHIAITAQKLFVHISTTISDNNAEYKYFIVA